VTALFEKYIIEKGVIGRQRLDREPYTIIDPKN